MTLKYTTYKYRDEAGDVYYIDTVEGHGAHEMSLEVGGYRSPLQPTTIEQRYKLETTPAEYTHTFD